MPTIQELDISEKDLPRHLKGGTAVRDLVLGPDGQLHGPTHCDGGKWCVIGITPASGDQPTRTVTVECGLCHAHLQVDQPVTV